jgi:pSer/pThr/pTyr-binding forkhead associated (FHA) protein
LHARVFRRDGHLMIEDLGSTNGTYLNRQRVTGPAVVRPGDLVQIGASVFEAR